MENIDITIIGDGVTGLASILYLTEKYPNKTIMLVEKNAFLGEEQSGRNSGIRHSSIQYKPGSKKATHCIKGNVLLTEFCKAHNIPYADTGKLTVATTQEEVKKLKFYYDRAVENGEPKTTSGTHLTPCFDLMPDGTAVISNYVHVGTFQQPIINKTDYETNRAGPELFVKDLQKFFPGLKVEDLELEFTKIQVKIEGYDEWVLERDKKHTNFINAIIDNPGFTASQSVGKYISELVEEIHAEKEGLEKLVAA